MASKNIYSRIKEEIDTEIKKGWNNNYGKISLIGLGLTYTVFGATMINRIAMPTNEIYVSVQQLKTELDDTKTIKIFPETTMEESMERVEQIYKTRQEKKSTLAELVTTEEYRDVVRRRKIRNRLNEYFSGLMLLGLVGGSAGYIAYSKANNKNKDALLTQNSAEL